MYIACRYTIFTCVYIYISDVYIYIHRLIYTLNTDVSIYFVYHIPGMFLMSLVGGFLIKASSHTSSRTSSTASSSTWGLVAGRNQGKFTGEWSLMWLPKKKQTKNIQEMCQNPSTCQYIIFHAENSVLLLSARRWVRIWTNYLGVYTLHTRSNQISTQFVG